MKTKIAIIILIFVISFACTKIGTEADGNLTVSGTVFYNSEPITNATVRLSNINRYETTLITNEDGYFEFQNVPNGEYELRYTKTFENGCFVERSDEINVVENCNFDNLLLPDAVSMYEPTDVTFESLSLSWSSSTALDFREYKIYRGLTSGLDETTGLLIHVSTTTNDTTFINHDLNPLETYYYRVYVMNDYGRLGGSNIVSSTTLNMNVIINGDFEIINIYNNFPENWQIWNNETMFTLDSLTIFSGNYSINVNYEDNYPPHNPIYQDIDPALLIEGHRYELSFWLKIEHLSEYCWLAFSFHDQQWNYGFTEYFIEGTIDDGDWIYYTYEFTIPLNLNASNFQLGFYGERSQSQPDYLNGWLDLVKIIKVD